MQYEDLNLNDIDGSNNVRRASPLLSNKGINILELCKAQGLGISKRWWVPFLETVCEDTKLLGLARSLAITGQIHPITVVRKGSSFCCISGQRRYIGMVMLECLRNIMRFGNETDINRCKELFNMPEMVELDFDKIQAMENEYNIRAEVKDSLEPEEADRLAFTANEEAEAMTDIDWAMWIANALQRNNPKRGSNYILEDLCSISGKSLWWLKQRQNLLALPKEWQEKLDSKEVTILKAAAYALELVSEESADEKPVATTAQPKTVPVVDVNEFAAVYDEPPQVTKPVPKTAVRPAEVAADDDGEDEDIMAIDADDIMEPELPEDGVLEPKKVKDWTEGTRKKRTAKPKMMKHGDIVNLLRSLDKEDTRAIEILAQVLMLEVEEAEELAGSSAEKI